MELLNQANLLIAIAAPIVLIIAINAVLQRASRRPPLFERPTPRIATPVKSGHAPANAEAANDTQHQRAA